ncbi:F-box/LRR-repeat MAX2 homolog A [Aristolochia californica]|uniref:F-box/LRR-repeat MAX2 homolog A n=1 Tax=Aristolochia californica TaxID=171875 RepID=UPI0035E252A3
MVGGTSASMRDIPEEILGNIFALITDTRTRNCLSLVCRKWHDLERATRTSLSLRGNVRNLFLVPICFRAVTHLDLSLLSPWGQPPLHSSPSDPTLALRLAHAFPSLTSLTLYARTPETLALLAPRFPRLVHVKLVRWHQRAQSPLGSDFSSLFHSCSSLSSLDLSHFYCWTEDLPPALQAYPSTAASITCLNLLSISCSEGFKSNELLAISSACPNLAQFLATCTFDPRYMDFVGDETLVALASNCPRLRLLHLADASALSGARPDPESDGYTADDARISCAALDNVFALLPLLEELALDVCQNVRDTGRSLEALHTKCPSLRALILGRFHGVCKAVGPQLDGIALCRGLESLSVKNCADLDDYGLIAIAQGCPKLTKFHIQGCKMVTDMGFRKFASILSHSLVDVGISACKNLDGTASLLALEPIRHRIQRLHIDCVWKEQGTSSNGIIHDFDLNELDSNQPVLPPKGKKSRYTNEAGNCSRFGGSSNGGYNNQNSCRTWWRLSYLSLWVPVGGLLTPLLAAGLDSCPELEEIRIKVEGDCRRRPKPTVQAFDLAALSRYSRLLKLRLDCGDVIGYVLTAPSGHMDLSLWERFFLTGIGDLNLTELDYWPPHDRDVNQRSLSLPAAGLLAQCSTLRKLFIHGTTHEHFLTLLLNDRNSNLRDVQLREDYYPAPENDMSTEMRVDSCTRFEDALNRRNIND